MYNNVIGRSDVASVVPPEVSYDLINGVAQQSFLMRQADRLRNMTAYEQKMPVLSALASASFPNSTTPPGETGLSETTEVNWADVSIYAEELAVIVPVPRTTISDAKIPIWDEVKKELITAAGAAIDNAQLYGTNKPSTWPTAIVTAAVAASHNVSLAGFTNLYLALLGEGGVFAKVEEDGFAVDGVLSNLSMKSSIRGTVDTNKQPIFNTDPAAADRYMLGGSPCWFPTTGITNATYKMIAGAWKEIKYSVRQDISFEVFTEGIIQDRNGAIVFNLMQQRMAALQLTMRLGFAVPNIINRVNSNGSTRYPFAVLVA